MAKTLHQFLTKNVIKKEEIKSNKKEEIKIKEKIQTERFPPTEYFYLTLEAATLAFHLTWIVDVSSSLACL